jgi:hypothetical protein
MSTNTNPYFINTMSLRTLSSLEPHILGSSNEAHFSRIGENQNLEFINDIKRIQQVSF